MKLGLLGMGNMASALAKGFLASGKVSGKELAAFDPVAAQYAHDHPPERDRLGHVVDSFAPGFRLAPGFDVTANFSAEFPA